MATRSPRRTPYLLSVLARRHVVSSSSLQHKGGRAVREGGGLEQFCKLQAEIDRLKEKLNEGYEIGYIGKKNHPESEAVLELSEKVHLVETENDETIQKHWKYTRVFFSQHSVLNLISFPPLSI